MIRSTLLMLTILISLGRTSFAAGPTGQEQLRDIYQGLSTFPNYRGKCGSLKMTYLQNEAGADQLQVSFKSKGQSFNFSIFAVDSKDNDLGAPGISWYKYTENGNARIDYQYLTFLKSENDLNSAPSQEGSKFLQVFIAFYPATKRIVQFGVLVAEGRPNQNPRTLLWSRPIGSVQNCDEN